MDFSFDSSSSFDSGDGGGSESGSDGGSGGGYDGGSGGGYDSSADSTSTDGGSGGSSYYGDEAGNADIEQAASSAYTGDDVVHDSGTHDSTELPATEPSEPAVDPAPVTEPASMDCPPVATVSDPNALGAVPDPSTSVPPDAGGPLGVTESTPAGDPGFVPSGAVDPAPALVPDAGAGQQGPVDVSEPAHTDAAPTQDASPGVWRGALSPQVEQAFQQTGWRLEMAPDGHGGQIEMLRPPEHPADMNVYRGQLMQAVHALQTEIARQQGLPAPAAFQGTVLAPGAPPLPAGAPTHVTLNYIPEQIPRMDGLGPSPVSSANLHPSTIALQNMINQTATDNMTNTITGVTVDRSGGSPTYYGGGKPFNDFGSALGNERHPR